MILRAGSLLYTILICLILSIMSSGIIFLHYYQTLSFTDYLIKDKLMRDAKSAIYAYCHRVGSQSPTESFHLYNGSKDSINIQTEKWGIYEIVTSKVYQGHHCKTARALIGNELEKKRALLLYLSDNNIPLTICGKTFLNGNCALPKAGVKSGYIEGFVFTGSKANLGNIYSNQQIPTLSNDLAKLIDANVAGLNSMDFSDSAFVPLQYSQPFSDSTFTINSNKALYIEQNELDGKIIISSKIAIAVSMKSSLHDIILIAPQVKIEKGFTGSCQIFARDSVIIEEDVHLQYPSSICASNSSDATIPTRIYLGPSSSLAGCIISNATNNGLQRVDNLEIKQAALVTGVIYCTGNVNMQGNLGGSLYCNGLILRTPGGVYTNYLLNSRLDLSLLPNHFATWINDSDSANKKEIIKWL